MLNCAAPPVSALGRLAFVAVGVLIGSWECRSLPDSLATAVGVPWPWTLRLHHWLRMPAAVTVWHGSRVQQAGLSQRLAIYKGNDPDRYRWLCDRR